MLTRKMFRELWQNKVQFFNIFLMVFLAVFAFTGIHAYMDGMTVSGNDFYRKNHLADLWINGESSEENLEKLQKTKNIKTAEARFVTTTKLAKINSKRLKNTTLETTFLKENRINKLHIVEGTDFDKSKSGIYLDYFFARENNVKLGDTLELNLGKIKLKEKVIAFVETPDKLYLPKNANEIFPTHQDFGFAFLSMNSLPDALVPRDHSPRFNQIVIELKNQNKLSETRAAVRKNSSEHIAIITRQDLPSFKVYQSEIDEGKTYSTVFTALFVFIAILSVITTTTRFINKQRNQIGTLKALGFSKYKITLHYLSYNFFVTILAATLGFIIGANLFGNFFLGLQGSFFAIPNLEIALFPIVFRVATIIVVLITLTTYLSCRRILLEPAAEAIRAKTPKMKTHSLDRLKSLQKLSIITRWNLRDISRNKVRTLTSLAGLSGCCALLILAFGMLDTMHYYMHWKFDILNNFNTLVELEEGISPQDLKAITADYGSATSQNFGVEIKNDQNNSKNSTAVIVDAADKLKFSRQDLQDLRLQSGGVYLTEKLAKSLGKTSGDDLEFKNLSSKTWQKTKIIGLNRDPQDQNLTMTRQTAEDLGLKYHPTHLYTDKKIKSKPKGAKATISIRSLKDGVGAMIKRMMAIVHILVALSIVLAFVIIYNIGTLSLFEKNYQFATMKVLGFSTSNIRKIFELQGLWITVVAIIIGLPLGTTMTDYIFRTAIGEEYDFFAHISLKTYVITIIGVALTSLLAHRILSRKIKQVDMVSSLKASE